MLSIFKKLPKVKNIRPAEQTKKYGALHESTDGMWRMEKGPLRQPFTVTSEYLEETGFSFQQVLLANSINPLYKVGGFDGSLGDPHVIELDEEFIYVDWRGPHVWKIYHNGEYEDRGVMLRKFFLVDELKPGVNEETALVLLRRHMKRSD